MTKPASAQTSRGAVVHGVNLLGQSRFAGQRATTLCGKFAARGSAVASTTPQFITCPACTRRLAKHTEEKP